MQEKVFYRFKNALKKILPGFFISWYHLALSALGATVYGFPGSRLKVVGVTGTNGKSTVVEMTSRILEEAGLRVASLSSIKFRLAGQDELNEKRMTLPGRFFVQKFLRKAVDEKCDYAVLEITSEGIKQHRQRFINFEAVVFTNLTPEHIEAHGSFEKYREAKGRLFAAAKNVHVINLDDENAKFFLDFPAREKWGYSLNSKVKSPSFANATAGRQKAKLQNFIEAKNVQVGAEGSKFFVNGLEFRLNLLGEFNVANALAAIGFARSQKINVAVYQKALSKIESLPGRMEEVVDKPFKVFVDYAFTPNALEKVYQTLTGRYAPDANKLICVLGACGGGRDKWKRPVLGQIASRYCGQIILTNEDPYDESPEQIVKDIEKGIQDTTDKIQNTSIVLDRREAINKALDLAQPGDTVVITGKGCEPSICLALGQRIPWDDRQVVREEYQKLKPSQSLSGFEILPHTADIQLKVSGRNLRELFKNAAQALTTILEPQTMTQKSKVRTVKIKSVDQDALLVDFLNKVLYLSQTNDEVYSQIGIEKITKFSLEARLSGEKVKSFGQDLKAATHYGLAVSRLPGGAWQAKILFDI